MAIKIKNGKRGVHLMINGLYINHSFDGKIHAIKNENGIPYGATEWVSVAALRAFWHKYMILCIHSLKKPVKSVWGQLEFIED